MKKVILVLILATFVACGKKKAGSSQSADKATETVKIDENAPKREVVVEAGDNIKFSVVEIKVKSGEAITLTLNNVGKMLKMSMGHNLVILKVGTDMEKFATDAIGAASDDYIPNGGKDVVAHTKMLGGGESDTITFMAPEKGTYDFLCSFPGHWGTMKGKFIVE